MGYGLKQGGRVIVKKFAFPTLSSNEFTFDNSEHSISLNGIDSKYMTVNGSIRGTTSGEYSVTVTLGKNCKWSNGSKEPYVLTWNIKKKVITVPSVSGDYAFVGGTTRYANITNNDSNYISTSGTTSSSSYSSSNYTVKFDLIYPNDTEWFGGGNGQKTGTWKVTWKNGQSHYANDIYNKGWKDDKLVRASGSWWLDRMMDEVSFNSDRIKFKFSESDYSYDRVALIYTKAFTKETKVYCSARGYELSVYSTMKAGTSEYPNGQVSGISTYGDTKVLGDSDKFSTGYGNVKANKWLAIGASWQSKGTFEIERIWY